MTEQASREPAVQRRKSKNRAPHDRITRQWPAELHEQAHGLYLRSVLAALAGDLDMARLLATEATETRTDLQGVAQLGDPNPS
jgi:hypothetical protein